jgi:two-component system sensor histidine kinase DesK
MGLLPKNSRHGWTPYAWTVYLLIFITYPALKPHSSPLEWTLTIAAALLFLALYFRGWWVHGRELLMIVAAITILGIVSWPFNPGGGCFFIYAAAFAGLIGTRRTAFALLGTLEAIVAIEAVVAHVNPFNAVWPLLFVLLVGGVNMHFVQEERNDARLRLAHDEIEHLAKVAERERIARDLHDLLGHTLSVIILKSELASKLADRDIDRARNEIRDVERISRDALAQVRNAVGGFRSRGLQAEIESSRDALTAANVTLDVDLEPLTLQPGHEAVLALAIREGVTNVVRHARASRCTIRLRAINGKSVLTIADDGRGGTASFGNGLIGMRERVQSLGGTLERGADRGTTLTIAIPGGGHALLPVQSEQTA